MYIVCRSSVYWISSHCACILGSLSVPTQVELSLSRVGMFVSIKKWLQSLDPGQISISTYIVYTLIECV